MDFGVGIFFKHLFLSAHWTIMMEKPLFFKSILSRSPSLISDDCYFSVSKYFFLFWKHRTHLSSLFALLTESLQELL